jgi:hypothetical protein
VALNVRAINLTMPKPRALVPLLLILSASAILQAQTFEDVDYLYRATDEAKPQDVLGTLTFDPAKKEVAFIQCEKYWSECDPKPRKSDKSKKSMLSLDIPANTVTSATYRYAGTIRKVNLFLTIQYTTGSGDRKYALFKLVLNDLGLQDVLAAAEATLGIKVVKGGA